MHYQRVDRNRAVDEGTIFGRSIRPRREKYGNSFVIQNVYFHVSKGKYQVTLFSYISNMSERGFKVDRKANPFSIFISYLPRNFVSLDASRGKGKRVGEWINHWQDWH